MTNIRIKQPSLEVWHRLILVVSLVNATLFLSSCAGAKATQQANAQPTAIAPAGVPASMQSIQVSFKLDPRLAGGTYGGEHWVSPPTYGPIVQAGNTYLVEARADMLDAKGQPTSISPEWIAADQIGRAHV